MLRPEDDFELPVFDRPMEDPPSRVDPTPATGHIEVRVCR
jgi:hypothetical protein